MAPRAAKGRQGLPACSSYPKDATYEIKYPARAEAYDVPRSWVNQGLSSRLQTPTVALQEEKIQSSEILRAAAQASPASEGFFSAPPGPQHHLPTVTPHSYHACLIQSS